MELTRQALLFATLFWDVCGAQGNGNSNSNTVYSGFNSGNTFPDYKAKFEDDYVKEFTLMQNYTTGINTFNSVRLYTNIQAYTQSEPLSAIPAAIKTKTSMLLGIWTSGTPNITNELNALGKALQLYGKDFADAVVGICVGSEDLYRLSDVGIRQNAGIGAGPKEIVKFINDTRDFIKDTDLADKPICHVDTWLSWYNQSNAEVVDAVDFLGVDIYPYFENDTSYGLVNTFENHKPIFDDRLKKTVDNAKNKPVWITETGWPYATTGAAWGASTASTEFLRDYWRSIGCNELFGKVSTYWYTNQDANPTSAEQFAVAKDNLEGPRFDVSCAAGASNEVQQSKARPSPRSIFRLVYALWSR